ncbi:MAG TPA: chaperone ClpB, partial [Clostridiales bacterium]|nr:chaperone ClpB [Clostridiales bacterium]
ATLDDENRNREFGQKKQKNTNKNKQRIKTKNLDTFGTDLTAKAAAGQVDRVIGRTREINRAIQILNRRNKNNLCLLGEPGVGKTAIAEGLAVKIAKGEVPAKMKNTRVYLLDMTGIVAGTHFRGQFEARMKGILQEAKALGNVVLVIDEIHNIMGAGDAEGAMNAANIL